MGRAGEEGIPYTVLGPILLYFYLLRSKLDASTDIMDFIMDFVMDSHL